MIDKKMFWRPAFVVILGICQGISLAGETAEGLAEKVSEAVAWRESVGMRIKVSTSIESDGKDAQGGIEQRFRFYRDGERAAWRGVKLVLLDINDVNWEISYSLRTVMDSFVYCKEVGRVERGGEKLVYSEDREFYESRLNRRLESPWLAGGLWGRVWGNMHLDAADLLREADEVYVAEERVQVGEDLCYMVEGFSAYGQVTLWISPARGYNAVKWRIEKVRGDFFDDKPIEKTEGVTVDFRVDEWQEVEGYRIPQKATLDYKVYWGEFSLDEYKLLRHKYEVDKVGISPDFDSAGAFELDFRDGIPVLTEEGEKTSFIWYQGEVVEKGLE